MNRGILNRSKQWLARATYVAVACKLLIPYGYMPTALADGGPFILCQSYWPTAPSVGHEDQEDHENHENQDDHESSDDAWTHCALGALSFAAALSDHHEASLLNFQDLPVSLPATATLRQQSTFAFRSRAPPVRTPLPV